jgi:hypothetical protein
MGAEIEIFTSIPSRNAWFKRMAGPFLCRYVIPQLAKNLAPHPAKKGDRIHER